MEKLKKFIPFIVGVALIGVGIFVNIRSGELARVCTEETTATVISMREDFTTDADTDGLRYLYYPVIEYTVGEVTTSGELATGGNPPIYSIGEKLQIMYNPDDISEFIVKGENPNIVWIILVVLGVLFLGAGAYLVVKKEEPKNA